MIHVNMRGKICLVTGSTSGIGKVTAIELARMGATVVMLCRNRAKGETLQAEIKQADLDAKTDLIIADLTDLAQVRRAASEFQHKYAHLHVLIHNAGAIHGERKVTPDGLEATFVGNYLAPFLLTELLLETIKASAPARIVNVSSAGHMSGKIDFDDLQGAHSYNFLRAYSQSKLAQIYFTYELADRLKGTGVTVNALHPGLVASNFNSGTTGISHYIAAIIYRLQGISVEQGAETILYQASSPEVEGMTGKYYSECKETPSSPLSYDTTIRQRLWNVSEELLRQNALARAV